MIEVPFKAEVDENGKIAKIVGRAQFNAVLKSYAGKSVKLSISSWRKKRSIEQNSYYYGALIPQVIDGLVNNGYPRSELSTEIVHNYLKNRFLKTCLTSEDTGEQIEIVRGTASLTTVEFMVYIDDIAQWCAEFLNFVLLMPNEQAEIGL